MLAPGPHGPLVPLVPPLVPWSPWSSGPLGPLVPLVPGHLVEGKGREGRKEGIQVGGRRLVCTREK